jgi:hypothetical protein
MTNALLAIVALALIGSCAADEPVANRPVLRHISTALGEIRLGERWGAPRSESSEPTISLPSGAYPEAQSTWITRDSDRTVIEIGFNYDQGTGFARKLQVFSGMMGPPDMHERPIHPDSIERAVWTDSLTRLELIKHPTRSVATLYARMTDLRYLGPRAE